MNFIYTITIIFAIIFSTAAFTYLVLCDYKQNISNYILLTIILISAFTYILYLGNIVTESYNDTILTKTKIVYFIFIINVYIIYAIQVIYPKWKIKIGLLYFILPIALLFTYNLLSNDNLKITEIILSFKDKSMIVQKTSLIFKIIALVLLFNPIIYLIHILIRKKYINNNWLIKFSIVTLFNLISFIIIYLYNNIKLDIIYCYISICSIGILTYLQIFYLNHNNITPNTNFIRPKLEEINITDTEKKLDDNKPNFPVKALSYRGILFKRLEVYLSKTSAWQDPDLSISKLARELGTNRNTLLQSIKDNGYSNYVYYINSIRIDRFIKIIENDEINNFQDAFYEVGFRSRATAIRNFKNLTGVTPSEYFNNKNKLTNQ